MNESYKLDYIKEYEREYQSKWKNENIFEIDSIQHEHSLSSKYYIITTTPYIFYSLESNDASVIIRSEIMSKYQRLKGKRVLFPIWFNSSDQRIKIGSSVLKNEIKQFDNQSNLQEYRIRGRYGNHKWNKLRSLGIPEEEIINFIDEEYWCNYFLNRTLYALKSLGIGADWRRTFVINSSNKYYESFLKWQFETLKSLDKIKFGKSYEIWSPLDNSVCSDQDRLNGEGVVPQDFTLLKLLVVRDDGIPSVLNQLSSRDNIYLVSIINRPELCYGITNCWISPNEVYGAYEMRNGDIFICNEHSICNMSFQELTFKRGQFKCLSKFNGSLLIGIKVVAPLSISRIVYVLPILAKINDKGTGINISTPSDSPLDYASYQDLVEKEKYRLKYNVNKEWLQFKINPVIDIAFESTNTIAVKSYEKFNIKSQNDQFNIERASEYCYINAFDKGIMLVGSFSGEKVCYVKNKIKSQLLESGMAIQYSEPYAKVTARSGSKCVAALNTEWYINYGEDEWKERVIKEIDKINFGNICFKNSIKTSVETINKWVCSRNCTGDTDFGFKFPYDDYNAIDSLSSSTLSSIFSCISHLLQGDIKGNKPGTLNITPDKMTHQIWDYIILGKDFSNNDIYIQNETLDILRNEFLYWYPINYISSSSNIIHNHLIFFIFIHILLNNSNNSDNNNSNNNNSNISSSNNDGFKLPDSIHIVELSRILEANFDLSHYIQQFPADSLRMGLVDSNEFALTSNSSKSIKRIYNEIEWIQEAVLSLDQFQDRAIKSNLQDLIFENEMNRIILESEKEYERSNFRESLHLAFYCLGNSRDFYRVMSSYNSTQMNRQLIIKYIQLRAVLIYPIMPHFSQKIYELFYGKDSNISIHNARWPTSNPIDYKVLKKKSYLESVINKFKKTIFKFKEDQRKSKSSTLIVPKSGVIYYSIDHPVWYHDIKEYILSIYDQDSNSISKSNIMIFNDIKFNDKFKPHLKEIMDFISNSVQEIKFMGKALFENLDELEILQSNINYISKSIDIDSIHIKQYNKNNNNNNKFNNIKPDNPIIVIF